MQRAKALSAGRTAHTANTPLRLQRMEPGKFQTTMEGKLEADARTRTSTCVSTNPIPNVIRCENVRGKYNSLKPEDKKKMSFQEYTACQQDSIGRRGLVGQKPEDDFFQIHKCKCACDGAVTLLQDPGHDAYDEQHSLGCLFLNGGVAAVHISGHKDGDSVVPYDGNAHGILNMGLVKGYREIGTHVLFGWEVIQEFYHQLQSSETNFRRYFVVKLPIWCDGMRQHEGYTALALSLHFTMLAITLAWHTVDYVFFPPPDHVRFPVTHHFSQ